MILSLRLDPKIDCDVWHNILRKKTNLDTFLQNLTKIIFAGFQFLCIV